MAATSLGPEAAVSSTTVQVSSLTNSRGPQFLIVNQGGNLHSSGGAIQIVTATTKQENEDAIKRREILARQPSYCKILNDLKEADTSESEDREESQEQKPPLTMKGETVEVVEEATHTTQTVVINGQQYQIVTPSPSMEGLITTVAQSPPPPAASSVQYSTTGLAGGGTVFLPATTQQVVTVGGQGGAISPGGGEDLSPGGQEPFGQQRKREIRLMKNREAARECRNKKKEYIKCLENRVAVLENQNKALIEELKSLKELYTGQKN